MEQLRLAYPKTVGANWVKVAEWATRAFAKAGFDVVRLENAATGVDEVIRQVGHGEADFTVSLACGAWEAARGVGIYAGETLAVRGLALATHPGHNFFNFVRRDVGITSFAEIARKRPVLNVCAPPEQVIVGAIVRAYLKHYDIDLYSDIPAWGGTIHTGFHDVNELFLSGQANMLLRENSRRNPAGTVWGLVDFVPLSLDLSVAEAVAAEFGTPVVVWEPGFLKGQAEPVVTLGNAGYPIIVREGLDPALVEAMARALDRDSASHAISEDIFYSVRHAPETGAPLHPGAARYYDHIGISR